MFPKNFLWGSSTNAQQVEGGYKEGNKGLSIADVRDIKMDTLTDSNFDKFKIASDHYHHLSEDISYFGEMGLKIYRFTIAWTRIFPNGDDPLPNKAGLDFYDRMLTELEFYNIIPVVTLYAYDLPLALLEKYNGWMDRRCIDAYLNYVKTVVTYFKGRIKYYIPFNEQNFIFMDSEYMTGYKAQNNRDVFRLEHHFNLAYAQATVLIHQCDPSARTGGNIGNSCFYPKTCNPKDVQAADDIYYRSALNLGDVYFRGVYTKRYLNTYHDVDIAEIIHDGDLDIISRSEPDFLSTTYYMSTAISNDDNSTFDNINVIKTPNPYTPQTDWGWNIDPYGFKHTLEDLYHRYQLPIIVMENGLGAYDIPNDSGEINDTYRINYLKDHITALENAIEDGVKIEAYMTWSAIDLYSTREGLTKRYGFVYVDEDTLARRKKKSFYWYKNVIESNGSIL